MIGRSDVIERMPSGAGFGTARHSITSSASVRRLRRFDEDPAEQPVRFADTDWDFRPTHLMLSLTASCQLACDYCYIRGGDNPRNMPWEVAEAAIRFVAGNAKARGERAISIQFHGQGEPTAAWRLFRNAVMFAEMQANALELDLSLSVVSNGVLTKEKVEFLRAHRFGVGLSLDATKELNDAQRPMRSGRSTYDRVSATMRMLRDAGVSFSIRSTVTSKNVSNMTAFIAAMKEEGCEQIDFEPLCGAGRASDRDAEVQAVLPSFVRNFREAQAEGLRQGVGVSYSTARLDGIRTSFCGAYGTNLNFCVSTEGLVSSCYEVLEAKDPRAELFIYGHFDRKTRDFLLDYDRRHRLVELDVTSMGRCQDCFLKWNCGGDCISKASLNGIANVVGHNAKDGRGCNSRCPCDAKEVPGKAEWEINPDPEASRAFTVLNAAESPEKMSEVLRNIRAGMRAQARIQPDVEGT